MVKSVLPAEFCFGLAAALFATGVATLWCSSDLMLWLIHRVGEEYALGAENVIRTEGGGTLLTNPGAMIKWTMPFWFLAFLQIAAAPLLFWAGLRRLNLRCKWPSPR